MVRLHSNGKHFHQPLQSQQRPRRRTPAVARSQWWDDVFLDLDPQRGIVAGQRWKEALQKAAHRCEVVLALISTEWLASDWCKAEIDAAQLMGKKIIVALIGVDKSLVPLAAIFFGCDAPIVRGLDKIRGLVRAGVDRMHHQHRLLCCSRCRSCRQKN